MGPDMRGLDHSWVPLHLAIGWILTHDRGFVDNLPFDGSTRMLAVPIAEARFNGIKAKSIHDGWLNLCDALRTGTVRAQGIPYWRRSRVGGLPSKLSNVAEIFRRPRSQMPF